MASTEIQIQCVNERCKNVNSLQKQFCTNCGTPIAKRYLWLMGNSLREYKIGDLIENRFYYYAHNIVIDQQPNLIPPITSNIPEQIVNYLKLFKYRLHLPQIYGFILDKNPIWLLEFDSIPLTENNELIYPELFAYLEDKLAETTPLKQLNWLIQIAKLWQPLSQQKVLTTLFKPNNIRVDGNVIKLMELYQDFNQTPTLIDLGNLWSNWLDKLDDVIKDIVIRIVCSLQQALITDSEKLIKILEQSLDFLANKYYQRKYQIITTTNPGRKRKKNEDSCYPEPEIKKEIESGIETLAIVCDGLGGQQSGEVASRLGIQILQKELDKNYNNAEPIEKEKALINSEKIFSAISKANNKITGINNAKKRKERSRMGTTVVMSLALDHEIYLANVGDSRIYWITKNGCHQVTIDDDLASREVSLGYGFYREISKNPQNGALLQALGMEHSRKLDPHIKRFVPDEDCIFVLCSDGLSDFDRIEQYWKSNILPIIEQKITIEDAIQKLLDIGIKKNGHDNITIALVYCQLNQKELPVEENLSWEFLLEKLPDLPQPDVKVNFVKSDYIYTEKNKNKPLIKNINLENINLNKINLNKINLNKINSNNKSLIIAISSFIFIVLIILVFYYIKSSKNQRNSLNLLPNNEISLRQSSLKNNKG